MRGFERLPYNELASSVAVSEACLPFRDGRSDQLFSCKKGSQRLELLFRLMMTETCWQSGVVPPSPGRNCCCGRGRRCRFWTASGSSSKNLTVDLASNRQMPGELPGILCRSVCNGTIVVTLTLQVTSTYSRDHYLAIVISESKSEVRSRPSTLFPPRLQRKQRVHPN